MKKKIAILGSTGSIGETVLNIVRKDKKKFRIRLLTTNTNVRKIYNQAIDFKGLETGEDWFARIHPFTQDFRIGQPKGSYTGICSELISE